MNPNKVAFTDTQNRAIQFIMYWHDTQRRVGTVLPYVVHPIEVASLVGRFYPKNQDLIIAAYLHDVLEDTDCTPLIVEHEFGKSILALVKAVTAKDGDFGSWKERRQYQIDKIKDVSLDVVRLKACDMLSNAKSINFDKLFRPKKGYPKYRSDPDAVVWYYSEMLAAMGDRLGFSEPAILALGIELAELIQE